MSFSEDLQNLDMEDPGSWPVTFKGLAALFVIIAILAIGYFTKFKEQQQVLESKRGEEIVLRQDFEKKQEKSANLEAYEAQLSDMEEILQSMLRQLPGKTEIPSLLQDISQTALATGIRIEKFQPQPEEVKDFYAEKPIALRMVGSYHQFGLFVSGVASLTRVVILTMHDISLKPVEDESGDLALEGVVKTYRYVDETEGEGTQ
jgi:type IV pilus assembly protein PilO